MQEKELTGDALLAQDADYVREGTACVYYAYPSALLPRFLVPEGDQAGLIFSLRLLSSEWGSSGSIFRAALRVPGFVAVARVLLFERTVVEP